MPVYPRTNKLKKTCPFQLNWKRCGNTRKEIKTLKRTIEDLENKEIKLLDEMLGGKLSRDIYEKLEKKYNDKRREAETRLSQLEVDYDDPLDFLDKCIVIGSMLLFLHQKFNFEQRKNLLKAIFEKIYVRERTIVDVKLNMPFSIIFQKDIEKVFKKRPSVPTKEDIFEQIVVFTLSEQYLALRGLVEHLVEKAGSFLNIPNIA